MKPISVENSLASELLEFACGAAAFIGLRLLQRAASGRAGEQRTAMTGRSRLDDHHPLVQAEVMRAALNTIRLNEAAKNSVIASMGRICD